jgi:hypothetical protein
MCKNDKKRRQRRPLDRAANGRERADCQGERHCNNLLTILGDSRGIEGLNVMADTLATVRRQLGDRIAEMNRRAARLSPLDIHAQMDAIRQVAAAHGLAALESLAQCSSQLALLPGHRVATRCCLEHMDEALGSQSASDSTTILAALAVRLN